MKAAYIIALTTLCILATQTVTYAIPAQLIEAVIFTESSNRPHVESVDGCRGLGQIKKETWYWICELIGENWSFDEAFDPEKNRIVTEYYLNWLERYLTKKGHYSLELLCASYNAGPGTVRRYKWRVPPYPETQNYVKKIKAYLQNKNM